MKRTNSDSDVSTLADSSPYRFPNVASDYYVQSPSGDSYDGIRSSSRASPVYKSPSDSPSHDSASGVSSASLIYGSFSLSMTGPRDRRRRLNEKLGFDYSAIGEEVAERYSVAFMFLFGLAGFVLICAVSGFIIWGVSRQYVPEVAVEHFIPISNSGSQSGEEDEGSLAVDYFHAGIGQDRTGVPTKVVGLNCTVKIKVFNAAPYFGIHVTSTHVSLSYSRIRLAVNQLEEYYMPRKSHQAKSVILNGEQVPLYGASLGLDLSTTSIKAPVTLQLEIATQGNVLGFLVRVKSYRKITCNLVIDSSSNRPIKLSDDACSWY